MNIIYLNRTTKTYKLNKLTENGNSFVFKPSIYLDFTQLQSIKNIRHGVSSKVSRSD